MLISPFPKKVYEKNARIYKFLANPKRLEILNILKINPTSVIQLSKLLNIRPANVSQHLALLSHAKFVHTVRSGKNVIYSLVDKRIVLPCKILKELSEEGLL